MAKKNDEFEEVVDEPTVKGKVEPKAEEPAEGPVVEPLMVDTTAEASMTPADVQRKHGIEALLGVVHPEEETAPAPKEAEPRTELRYFERMKAANCAEEDLAALATELETTPEVLLAFRNRGEVSRYPDLVQLLPGEVAAVTPPDPPPIP